MTEKEGLDIVSGSRCTLCNEEITEEKKVIEGANVCKVCGQEIKE